MIVAPKEA